MQINVAQLLKGPIGATQDYQVDGTVDVVGGGSDATVRGGVRLMHTQRGILVKGELRAEVELTCSRCLSLYNCPVRLSFEEEYIPIMDIVSGAPLAPPGEPGSFIVDEHNVIDLSEAIRQYALLAVPMKPLCREDCAGLCPRCGHNLNQGPCGCPQEVNDARWSELSKLRNK